nr:MerR family DNA-binding protein [Acidobacteriota bacterium]
GQSPCAEMREIVRGRLQELDERMAQMKRYRKELAAALAEWDKQGERPGHICGLIEASDIKTVMSKPQRVKKGNSNKR